jgi:hypothetical protein
MRSEPESMCTIYIINILRSKPTTDGDFVIFGEDLRSKEFMQYEK